MKHFPLILFSVLLHPATQFACAGEKPFLGAQLLELGRALAGAAPDGREPAALGSDRLLRDLDLCVEDPTGFSGGGEQVGIERLGDVALICAGIILLFRSA